MRPAIPTQQTGGASIGRITPSHIKTLTLMQRSNAVLLRSNVRFYDNNRGEHKSGRNPVRGGRAGRGGGKYLSKRRWPAGVERKNRNAEPRIGRSSPLQRTSAGVRWRSSEKPHGKPHYHPLSPLSLSLSLSRQRGGVLGGRARFSLPAR